MYAKQMHMTSSNVHHSACVAYWKKWTPTFRHFIAEQRKKRFLFENIGACFFLNQIKSQTSQYGCGMSREGGSVPWKDLLIQNDNDAYVAKPLAWFAHKRANTSTQRHPNTNQLEEGGRLTISGLSRAKMAKVDSLSHTHLVRNELTDTALQLRVDQEPSSEELRREKDAVNGNGGKEQ